VTPAELLSAARAMVSRPRPATAGLWSRAAALLGRQALEAALEELWSRAAPGVERASMRCQLLCLPAYLQDTETARRAAHAWAALTNACHHHPYELPPTAHPIASSRVQRVARYHWRTGT
jgi:hypothetical protein